MRNFALNPKHVDKRFSGILEACQQNRLPDTEQLQYIRAMISEREKQEIAKVYLERGIEQGIQQGIQQGIEQGIKQGIAQGAQLEKCDVARRMLTMGIDPSVIAASTKLTESEIETLR